MTLHLKMKDDPGGDVEHGRKIACIEPESPGAMAELVGHVSVVIPAYNAAGVLRRAVDSVMEQTVRVREIIIVDDGSTDGTADLANSLAAEHAGWITWIQHPDGKNHGVSAARNLGIAHCRGEFIAFLDADDEWLPGKLDAQLRVFAQQPAVGLVHTFVELIKDPFASSRIAHVPPLNQRQVSQPYDCLDTLRFILEKRFVIYPSTVMLRSRLMQSIGFHEGMHRGEDMLLFAMLAVQTEFYTVAVPLCRYWLSDTSSTGMIVNQGGGQDIVWLDVQIRVCRFLKTQAGLREFALEQAQKIIPNQIRCCRQLLGDRRWRGPLIRSVLRFVVFFPGPFTAWLWAWVRRKLMVNRSRTNTAEENADTRTR